MNFAKHYNLKDQHALLGASKYQWIRYTDEKIADLYFAMKAKEEGTRLHAVAKELIELGIKLPDKKKTLNLFVNDAIGYRMNSEQVLYYSINCFGTADAICFRNNKLRIHDLKTGKIPAHFEQLEIYAAFFCLEYQKNPEDIMIILRLYQNNEILEEIPEPGVIREIMAKIILFDKRILDIQKGV